jgi:hypothetical protein
MYIVFLRQVCLYLSMSGMGIESQCYGWLLTCHSIGLGAEVCGLSVDAVCLHYLQMLLATLCYVERHNSDSLLFGKCSSYFSWIENSKIEQERDVQLTSLCHIGQILADSLKIHAFESGFSFRDDRKQRILKELKTSYFLIATEKTLDGKLQTKLCRF